VCRGLPNAMHFRVSSSSVSGLSRAVRRTAVRARLLFFFGEVHGRNGSADRRGARTLSLRRTAVARCSLHTRPAPAPADCRAGYQSKRPPPLVGWHWRAGETVGRRTDDQRYDQTRCYFNVRSKANMSQPNLPHGKKVKVAHTRLQSVGFRS